MTRSPIVKISPQRIFLDKKIIFLILVDIPFLRQQDVACSDPMTGRKGRESAEIIDLSRLQRRQVSFAKAHLRAVEARTRAPAKRARSCLSRAATQRWPLRAAQQNGLCLSLFCNHRARFHSSNCFRW
jgi:hypothetical protein